jgi:tRNA G18 (ribose-2'-O)-methylase SpoU
MSSPSASSPSSRDLKRAKYEAKQESQRMAKEVEQTRALWLNGREDYAAFITVQDVRDIKRLLGSNEDSVSSSSSCSNDARTNRLMQISDWIAPFFDLKELPTSKVTNERLFVSEGTEAVRMMIQRCVGGITNSSITCNPSSGGGSDAIIPPSVRLFSILTKPATFFDPPTRLLQDIEERSLLGVNGSSDTLPPFKIIIADEKAMTEIAGFPIARGAMACGVIPNYIQTNAYSWLKGILSNSTTSQPRRLLALDAVSNAANMGSIIRTAAAFSIDAIILSDDSCDAFYRQSVRTSMGHVISLPILRVSDWEKNRNEDDVDDDDDEFIGLAKILRWLQKTMNVECLAAVVDDDRERNFDQPFVLLEDQTETSRSWCCVLGNEGNGIRDTVIHACDVRVKIGMASGVDSLSLPIAAGILLHSLSSRSKKGQ